VRKKAADERDAKDGKDPKAKEAAVDAEKVEAQATEDAKVAA